MARHTFGTPKSTAGSLFFVAVLIAVVTVLHFDFWNWGTDTARFLAWTQEYWYRFVLVTILFPFFNYLIGRMAWPMPDSGGED